MSAGTTLSDETGQSAPTEPSTVIVNGQSVTVDDVVVFTVVKTDGKHEQIKVVLGGVEQHHLFKIVADTKRYYQILPALSIWQGNVQSNATAVAYLEEPQRLLLLGPSIHNIYRSYGQASERTVVNVEVDSATIPEPHATV